MCPLEPKSRSYMCCGSAGGLFLHLRTEALPGLAATDPAH